MNAFTESTQSSQLTLNLACLALESEEYQLQMLVNLVETYNANR